jgi:hypothetical protein
MSSAGQVQEALIDFDRFQAAGYMDQRATRQLVAHPQSMSDLTEFIAFFQDAADRANDSVS